MVMRTFEWIRVLPIALLTGCGLEALVGDVTGAANEPPATVVRGSLDRQLGDMTVLLANGTAVELVEYRATANAYEVTLPSAAYSNLRMQAHQGDIVLSTYSPELEVESEKDGVDISLATQVATILVDASLSASGRTLQATEPMTLRSTFDSARASLTMDGPAKELFEMAERLVAAGDTGSDRPWMFQVPVLNSEFEVVTSPLNPAWLSLVEVDYDGDGAVETGTTASAKFDFKLREALGGVEIMECLDPVNVRVVFAVDFNEGRLDGNCDSINRFRWVQDAPGKSMFFVGGVHEESEIQSTEVDAAMGNTAGWVPNQVAMYDDGTNGDETAGDNVWSITFVLPRGMRVGYKYTWGTQGALWTGSEEWPGNQHILEIVDVNEDGFVYRKDNFGDEASNKDKVNLNRRGNGNVTWETDNNEDGIPDARERPIDSDNDCQPDGWVTPTGVGPATVLCSG